MKQTNEMKFSSYGVFDLIKNVYKNKEVLLPEMGFRTFDQFLDWFEKFGDQDTQDKFEAIVKKHETEKMAPMTESKLKQTIKEEIKRILSEDETKFKEGDTVMYMGGEHLIISDNGYIIKLIPKKFHSKIVKLNHSQAEEKVRKREDFKEGLTDRRGLGAGKSSDVRGIVNMLFNDERMTNAPLALSKALNLLDNKTAMELNFKIQEFIKIEGQIDPDSPSNVAAIKAMRDMDKNRNLD